MSFANTAAEQGQDDILTVSNVLPSTIHYNTSFCARIIKPSQENGNSIACGGCYLVNDPINCFSHPEEYIRKNQTWSSCFDMKLNQIVSAYSDEDAIECGVVTSPLDGKERTIWCYFHLLNDSSQYLKTNFCMALVDKGSAERPISSEFDCNKMDDTWSTVFDTLNSTFNELLYYKLGDCDTHDYGRSQDIMFDDMNNNELQVYNEELMNRLKSPIANKHLDCFSLFNKKASVNDTRLTKIETYLCSNSDDCSNWCEGYPVESDYNNCKQLKLVGSRLGFDGMGWSYQRQEDDQVCITYADYIPNKYQQYACYSFCMNVGEETKVPFLNEFQIVRVSDKNDTVFTTVEVDVTRLYDSKYSENSQDDDTYGPDEDHDDYIFPSYHPTTFSWFKSQENEKLDCLQDDDGLGYVSDCDPNINSTSTGSTSDWSVAIISGLFAALALFLFVCTPCLAWRYYTFVVERRRRQRGIAVKTFPLGRRHLTVTTTRLGRRQGDFVEIPDLEMVEDRSEAQRRMARSLMDQLEANPNETAFSE